MSVDIEREDTKRKIEDLVYSFFLNQVREHQVDEKSGGTLLRDVPSSF